MNKETLLVIDYGCYLENAIQLGKDGYKVYYFCYWQEAFPKIEKALIGKGLKYIEHITNLYDYIDKVDKLVFFDTNFGDMVVRERSKNKPVFGAGAGEILELDRWEMRNIQKSVGLPTPETDRIVGLKSLRKYLEHTNDKFIKLNKYRGNIETFHHKDYKSSLPYIDQLAYDFGAYQNEIEFIAEEPIEGVETGYDGFCIDGKYPDWAMYGVEIKDTAYIAKVVRYNELPKQIKDVNDKLSPIMKKLGVRSMFDTEIRIDKSGKGFLIDPTIRAPNPPSGIEIEICGGFSEQVVKGAEGKIVDLKPKAKYGVEIILHSAWADEHWAEIEIPKEARQWIKLKLACKLENKYYSIPALNTPMPVCSVIGLGNTVEEAIKEVKKHAAMVKVYQLDEPSGFEEIDKELKNLREHNIRF